MLELLSCPIYYPIDSTTRLDSLSIYVILQRLLLPSQEFYSSIFINIRQGLNLEFELFRFIIHLFVFSIIFILLEVITLPKPIIFFVLVKKH